MADLEELVTPIPGNRYEFLQPIQMRFNELIAGVRAELAVKVFGDDFDELIRLGDELQQAIGAVPGAADVAVEQATGLPVLTVEPRRSMLARLGLTIMDLQDVVSTALGGATAGEFYEGDRRVDIVVRLPEELRSDPDRLASLPIPLPGGSFVPLGEVADLSVITGYNQILRENGKRRVVVTANVRGRDLGSFVADVQAAVGRQVEIPAGYWVAYDGTYEHLESATNRLAVVVPVTLLIIAVLLTMALGSIVDAAIIFSGVPLAFTGGVAALSPARHTVLHLGRGGFHRPVGDSRAQRPGDGDVHSQAPRGRAPADGSDRGGRADAPAPGTDDGAGRIPGIRAHGAEHRDRLGSPAAAGNGGHRRDRIVDAAHAGGAAGAVPARARQETGVARRRLNAPRCIAVRSRTRCPSLDYLVSPLRWSA